MEKQSEKASDKFIESNLLQNENIIIALIPISTYLIHFSFYAGVFSVFGLPLQFINFGISEIISTFLILLITIFGSYLVFKNLVDIIISKKTSRAIVLKAVIISYNIAFFIVLSLINPQGMLRKYTIFLIASLFLSIRWFIPPLLMRNKNGSYIEKMIAFEQEQRNKEYERKTTIDNFFDNLIPLSIKLFGYIFFLIIWFSFLLGEARALSQHTYKVLNGNSSEIILYTSGRMFVTQEIDLSTNTIIGNYQIYDFSGSEKVSYYYVEIGPLNFEKSYFFNLFER